MVLIDGQPTKFKVTGTKLTFTPKGTTAALTGITSADVSGLTTKSKPVYVADQADDKDNTDCLKRDRKYHKGSTKADCNGQLWYFVTGMNV